MTRRIIAIGGGGFLMERRPSLLDEYFVRATGARSPKVCFISTAAGDPEEMLAKYYKAFSKLSCRPSHLAFFRRPRRGSIPLDQIERRLLAQDAIYVGGGNTRSMLAVWREWGLDQVLRRAWNAGVLLGGMSAGAICWFKHGATDSVLGPGRSSALSCLGFLPGSCSPHFAGEPRRRRDFRRLIARGSLPSGIGIDDGVAVLYRNQTIAEVVSSRTSATAYRVGRASGAVVVTPLPATRLYSKPNRRLQVTRMKPRAPEPERWASSNERLRRSRQEGRSWPL
jgi:peptidase E